MNPRRRATLRDIAESLDLSVNTVSRVLSDKDGTGAATRQRVKDEAERLGYVPNTMARSLVAGRAMTLGLVITNPSNPFYARLISAIEERGRVHGYALMLMVTEDSVDDERRATEELMRWGVDGVLGVPVQHGAEHWTRLRKSGTPVVLINRSLDDFDAHLVGVDYYAGARAATEHALDRGATSVCLVEEGLDVSPVAARIRGFRDVLAERRLNHLGNLIRLPDPNGDEPARPFDPRRAHELGLTLVPTLETGSTVLAGNDYDALGIYRALAVSGLVCPKDVGIIGFGDHPFSAYLTPPLTTVRLPAAGVGRACVDKLLELIAADDDTLEATTTLLAPELIVRESTGVFH